MGGGSEEEGRCESGVLGLFGEFFSVLHWVCVCILLYYLSEKYEIVAIIFFYLSDLCPGNILSCIKKGDMCVDS